MYKCISQEMNVETDPNIKWCRGPIHKSLSAEMLLFLKVATENDVIPAN